MVNLEHVKVVLGGADSLQEWRAENPKSRLDLSHSNLSKSKLSKTNLSRIYGEFADFSKSDMSYCDLSEAYIPNSVFDSANLTYGNLFKVHALDSRFDSARFSHANCEKGDFFGTILSLSNLSKANFSKSNLAYTHLDYANLKMTLLCGADLMGTEFHGCYFEKTDFTNSRMRFTTFAVCNLNGCIGLESAKVRSMCSIDVGTLIETYEAHGKSFSPEIELFLLNAGVPKSVLDSLPAILANIEYCTCFVCYGEPDKAFAERLVKDLRKVGVSCWLYSMDATPGKPTWAEIGQKRRDAEKMIVLCSSMSLIRDGVLKEVEEQIDDDSEKIVPISLDNLWKESGFVIKRGTHDLKPFLVQRNYADFSDKTKYKTTFCNLLKGITKAHD